MTNFMPSAPIFNNNAPWGTMRSRLWLKPKLVASQAPAQLIVQHARSEPDPVLDRQSSNHHSAYSDSAPFFVPLFGVIDKLSVT